MVKNDEFYTQLGDIERELIYYKEFLKNKIIYCNCDSMESNFFKYFFNNFEEIGLKQLVASSYNFNGNGKIVVYDGENIQIRQLQGNGDFRSEECIDILKDCDVVITNPPFSLIREFIRQLINYNKKFLILGTNAIPSYLETFQYIKNNQLWTGVQSYNTNMKFEIPDDCENYKYIIENDKKLTSINGICWWTNIEHNYRPAPLELKKTYYGNEEAYPKYDNCDAINVNKTKDIPYDYDGLMGVPITFIGKWSPKQFELLKTKYGDDNKKLTINGKYLYNRILIKKR